MRRTFSKSARLEHRLLLRQRRMANRCRPLSGRAPALSQPKGTPALPH